MWRYIGKRLLMIIPVLVGVTLLVFVVLSLAPGDPAVSILGDKATEADIEAKREELGLNDPILIQYLNYVSKAIKGDFGVSYKNQLSVMKQVLDRFPNTLIIAVGAILFSLVLGIPVGILSAKKQYSMIDNIAMIGALIGVSMPVFWMGLLMVIVFSLRLRLLPSSGMGEGFIPLMKSLVLPVVALGSYSLAMIARTTRSSVLEVIRQDYISTARSKGITERQVTTQHMLKNALIPIITAVGLQFGTLMGGSIMTETVFSWPGIGRLIVDSIKSRDIPMVMGSVIFLSVIFSFVNLLIDLLYAFVDPQIKSQYKGK
ncbi:ABC transporter permease [Anaeropeptidivorans aminofermentans]|jgi:peptide/nickel transport system permease protein|uniref:ABC transporter permease n=1 Tax=Anaeropeptidivorans aminofermentans TaxID=2934315 RepID=UPI002024C687|nr:ABC transporter permease [Anaeropeptidivorans aminofermentans]